MANKIKIRAHPKLREPNMVVAWPGIGEVATIVISYLLRKLDFKILAEIDSSHFFDPTGVLARNGMVEEPQFPYCDFYYWKNRTGERDLIVFAGEAQPVTRSYELANLVIDVGMRFNLHRVYTCAAALTKIHYTEEPHVWGIGTTEQTVNELATMDIVKKGAFQISGLNGLVLGVAKERGVDGACLLGEIPSYASHFPNPMAALAIIRILTRLLKIELDTKELEQFTVETQRHMRQFASELMEQYIDYFTEPIWESGEEYEEDDEDGPDETN